MTVASTYDFPVVLLSILIAVLASYTALDLGGRVRGATGWVGWGWIASASIAMVGGIWSMFFVAMLAFVLLMPLSYYLGLTAASLLLAVVVTAAWFTVA